VLLIKNMVWNQNWTKATTQQTRIFHPFGRDVGPEINYMILEPWNADGVKACVGREYKSESSHEIVDSV